MPRKGPWPWALSPNPNPDRIVGKNADVMYKPYWGLNAQFKIGPVTTPDIIIISAQTIVANPLMDEETLTVP